MNSTPAIPKSVTVKAGHVQPLWAGHPWVFRQAVERLDDGLVAGDEVIVVDPHGKILGRGLYSPSSAIAVRLFTSQGKVAIDGSLLRERLERAVAPHRHTPWWAKPPQPLNCQISRAKRFHWPHSKGKLSFSISGQLGVLLVKERCHRLKN